VNTFPVTRADGTTKQVIGESYIAGSLTSDLVVIDQFGGTVASFAAGAWTDITILTTGSGNSADTSYQPVITAADPDVPGTYLNSRSIFNGPNG
jgi:hypothetical protein